jgi:hypothetical protein
MALQKDFTQTQVRLPTSIYEELKESADRNFRSLNGEILYWLQLGMGKATPPLSAEEARQVVREELAKAVK